MKRFLFLYYGYEAPTQEIMDAWSNWFASIEDRLIDGGSPFAAGREITHAGTRELSPETGAAAGYSIIEAQDMDEAERIARRCPIIAGVRVYETM